MSKENPTPSEKRRRTSLSKSDNDTLIGIILRKDASEKEYKTKINDLNHLIDEQKKAINDLDNRLKTTIDKYKAQESCAASVNKTHKAIIESLKSKYNMTFNYVNRYRKLLMVSLAFNILLAIFNIIVVLCI